MWLVKSVKGWLSPELWPLVLLRLPETCPCLGIWRSLGVCARQYIMAVVGSMGFVYFADTQGAR